MVSVIITLTELKISESKGSSWCGTYLGRSGLKVEMSIQEWEERAANSITYEQAQRGFDEEGTPEWAWDR